MKANLSVSSNYTGIHKDHGPPHRHFNATYDPIDKNEYLLERGVDIEALRNVHAKQVAA